MDNIFEFQKMDIRDLEKLVVALRTCNPDLPSIVDALHQVQTSTLPNRRNKLLSANDHPMIAVIQHLSRVLLVNEMEQTTNKHFIDMLKTNGYDVKVGEDLYGTIQTKKGIIAYGY